jgi:hypothetical protein
MSTDVIDTKMEFPYAAFCKRALLIINPAYVLLADVPV